jgi:NTE family protein
MDGFETALVLGGGNALGAYHLGACETLLNAGVTPSWYLGTSIGAVVAALLVGNPPETRLDRLRTFWEEATQAGRSLASSWLPEGLRARLNNDHALSALLFGRPGLFGRDSLAAASRAYGRCSPSCRRIGRCAISSHWRERLRASSISSD